MLCSSNMRSEVVSTGSYVPARVVRNEDLLQFPQSSLPLIEEKTGVRERRHAADSECASDLAAQACQRCLESAGADALSVEGIILSTSSPDRPQPPTAARVQHLIGAARAFAVDINAVCSGGLYALHLADSLIRSGMHRTILVVAADVYSRILNPQDFSTYPYFGDGAGAVLLRASKSPGVIGSTLGTDGSKADVIQVPAGGSMLPYRQLKNSSDQYFKMNGKQVFEFATAKGAQVASELLSTCGMTGDQITCLVPHQANVRIIRHIAQQLQIPAERCAVNLDRFGNTASASVLIALDEARKTGPLQNGGSALLVAFGGGLSWAASLVHFN